MRRILSFYSVIESNHEDPDKSVSRSVNPDANIMVLMSKKSCGIFIEFAIVHKIGYNKAI